MRTRARKDRNEAEIVSALRKLGCTVEPIRSLRGGVPDLLVGLHGRNHLVEIKVPLEGRLSESQKLWRDDWRGEKPIVLKTTDDVVRWVALVE